MCFGYSKESYQREGSFEHSKCMLKFMDKKIFKIVPKKLCLYLQHMCSLKNKQNRDDVTPPWMKYQNFQNPELLKFKF